MYLRLFIKIPVLANIIYTHILPTYIPPSHSLPPPPFLSSLPPSLPPSPLSPVGATLVAVFILQESSDEGLEGEESAGEDGGSQSDTNSQHDDGIESDMQDHDEDNKEVTTSLKKCWYYIL